MTVTVGYFLLFLAQNVEIVHIYSVCSDKSTDETSKFNVCSAPLKIYTSMLLANILQLMEEIIG